MVLKIDYVKIFDKKVITLTSHLIFGERVMLRIFIMYSRTSVHENNNDFCTGNE